MATFKLLDTIELSTIVTAPDELQALAKLSPAAGIEVLQVGYADPADKKSPVVRAQIRRRLCKGAKAPDTLLPSELAKLNKLGLLKEVEETKDEE